MIIYIHGFGGSGEGSKAKILRQLFRSDGFIAPSLPTNPELAIATLSELIEIFRRIETVMLIGSSLGGFYALHLASKYNLKAVLINPAVRSYETLSRALGVSGGENFYDGSRYEWNESHLQTLKSLISTKGNVDNILLLLQKGDELLDYSDAATQLEGCEQIIEEGGDHSFQGIERHVEIIKQFLSTAEKTKIQSFPKVIDEKNHFGLAPEVLSTYEIDLLLDENMMNSERITQAITFSAKAHGTQMTPMGFPYLHHLMTVATHVMVGTRNDGFSIEDQENAIIAALLHDTIEDTAIEYTDVREAFGDGIANAVSALTKNKLVGEKQAQMEDSLSRIKAQPKWVWCVKMADRITNLTGVPAHWDEAKKQKYLREARVLWSALHEASKDLSERLLRKIERYE